MPPYATWHSRGRTPPLPHFFTLCHTVDRSFSNRARNAVRSSVTHSSLTPSRAPHLFPPLLASGPPPPATRSPSLARVPAERRHRPPFPGELLLEPPILAISCNFLTPLPLLSCRISSHSTMTTGAPSPPANAAVPELSSRLAVDSPFRCAPALSSLPDTFPVAPSRSPATPCHRRETAKPSASTPPRSPARGERADARAARAARARCNGPRRPFAPLGWAARPCPSRRFGPARRAANPRGL
jgi:hypothetical protein